MILDILYALAVGWLTLTSLALLLSHSWRWSVAALALQYAGVSILVSSVWPIEMSAAKLVAGWMASAVLGAAISEATISDPRNWQAAERAWPASRAFRLLAASLVGLTVVSLVPNFQGWFAGIEMPVAAGSLVLIGMGLLHLGLTAHPLRVVIGLLTVLSGFGIIYAAVETSTLIAGLLAAVDLGLALIGAYLLLVPLMETE